MLQRHRKPGPPLLLHGKAGSNGFEELLSTAFDEVESGLISRRELLALAFQTLLNHETSGVRTGG